MRYFGKARLAACVAVSALALVPGPAILAAPAPAQADQPVYKDASAPVDARVDDLLARMTLEEKVAQLQVIWENKDKVFDKDLQFVPAKASKAYPDGIGGVARPSDAHGPISPRVEPGRDTAQTIKLVNAMQRWAMTKTRLGIPILFHEEGLHGYAALGATSFPQAIALASTWDPDLVRQTNAVTAREIRARGVTQALSPVVDIARDPRWGRIEETFGEDPYLVGEMGVAAVEGLQGPGHGRTLRPGKVFATLKHLTGHGQPESGENVGPAQISERELRNYFFPPFQQVIKRTAVEAVMPSYNEIDGVPSHANKWLLTDVLRGEWGFKGVVVSDYSAIDQLQSLHHVAGSLEQAAREALDAGVDMDLPDGLSYQTLVKQVRDGKVPMAEIDQAVRYVLEMKFRAGLFENPYADVREAEAVTNTADARALAQKAAEKAVVLLKNDGTLPLKATGTIAVIGPDAAKAHLGGYYGQPPSTVSLLDGVRSYVGDKAKVTYAEGVRITKNDDWWADKVELADPAENAKRIQEAVAVARGADTIILNIGGNEQTSREGWAAGHLGDRASLKMVGQQQALFDALKALGKPIVVVLTNGRPLATVKVADQANALMESWYLGEQTGTALARTLFGAVNPGGKLPVTIPRDVGQIPLYYNYKPSAHRGYLFTPKSPLFPFGYGLSYTSFDLSVPRLSKATIGTGGSVQVSVDVKNTGSMAGDEVVQLYIRDQVSSVTTPVKALKGFQRVTLKPGEQRTVTFTLTPEAFALWNLDMNHVVEPGDFDIMTGDNSVDLKKTVLTITE
ncbi:glycoside hydrolase family 3 N-terminal domain-containing protein [Stakelama marina]|uniref:Beta-D-glucoside glucohydrolase n=1 Tax=Stakelama marina TaxID=2826939 RepID=A0A8T4ICZ6_9SPHN|nr:glycoside hydrolase family 3 N-terminal domain-containing protein [Stakelama marina]MBR0552517.1 glycoside hydrolase family 3 C-terminal domain-containing protein [Stakelama marina]